MLSRFLSKKRGGETAKVCQRTGKKSKNLTLRKLSKIFSLAHLPRKFIRFEQPFSPSPHHLSPTPVPYYPLHLSEGGGPPWESPVTEPRHPGAALLLFLLSLLFYHQQKNLESNQIKLNWAKSLLSLIFIAHLK